MNDKPEFKKNKTKASAETPVHTLREGGVAASIWRRQSPAGYVYYDFSLTRSWKSLSSGSTGYSKHFFVRNYQELMQVIEQASRWIAEHEARLTTPGPIPPANPAATPAGTSSHDRRERASTPVAA